MRHGKAVCFVRDVHTASQRIVVPSRGLNAHLEHCVRTGTSGQVVGWARGFGVYSYIPPRQTAAFSQTNLSHATKSPHWPERTRDPGNFIAMRGSLRRPALSRSEITRPGGAVEQSRIATRICKAGRNERDTDGCILHICGGCETSSVYYTQSQKQRVVLPCNLPVPLVNT